MIAARLAFLVLVTVPFILLFLPIQLLILGLRLPFWPVLPRIFHRLLRVMLGLRVEVRGAPVRGRAVLLVSNHISWLDIPAIAGTVDVSFVAKSEVGRWPVIGFLAGLQKTIFVDRTRRTDTGRTSARMRAQLAAGRAVLLFAEGTSDIGTHVLPFRSALLGAAAETLERGGGSIAVQPMTIAYRAVSALPLSHSERHRIAWIGEMGLGDTLGHILSSGPKDIVLAFGTPLAPGGDRKAMASTAEAQVRAMLVALNRGLALPS